MSTRRISDGAGRARLLAARDRVFASADPFDRPFADAIVSRALLFPVSYELEPGQLAALRTAARAVGDDTYFLELLEYDEHERYWEIPLDDDPYEAVDYVLENALFSPSGQWGLIVSEEDHAVVGGGPDFMRVIAAEFPPTESPAQHFWGPSSPADLGAADAPIEEKVSALTAASEPIPTRAGAAFGDDQALAFIEFWKELKSGREEIGDWLPGLLVHLYGEERGRRLVAEGGW